MKHKIKPSIAGRELKEADKELDNAKIDGPEPEILHPRAPAEIEDFLIS